jgi:hypothetical protein
MWFYLKQWAKRLVDESSIQVDIIDRFKKFISFIVEDLPKGQPRLSISLLFKHCKTMWNIDLVCFLKMSSVSFDKSKSNLSNEVLDSQ